MTEDYVSILITNMEDSEPSAIKIYPNPAKDRLQISSAAQIESLRIFNSLGQLVLNKSYASEKFIVLKLDAQKAGVYFVQIKTRTATTSRRLLISK
jgi:hypothetical protein